MKTKHTPGPWYVDYDGIHSDEGPILRSKVWEGIGQPIGIIYFYEPDCPDNRKECEANGNLAAAAPELLESLHNLINAASGDTIENLKIALADAKAIIKKTTE